VRGAALVTAGMLCLGTGAALAQLNTVITDGRVPFAEGRLVGYIVQVDGIDICSDPHVIGRYISCLSEVRIGGRVWRARSRQPVWAETNGTLGAMIVVDAEQRERCQDPGVWIAFRGGDSFILCLN